MWLDDPYEEQEFAQERYEDEDRLRDENEKLREACAELLQMAESNDPDWLHWPEMHRELRKLGVEVD